MSDDFLLFWRSPPDALFPPDTIARIRNVGVANLERERQKNIGPKYLKLGNRILYRKCDVLAWIALHEKASALVITALNKLGREDADVPDQGPTTNLAPPKRPCGRSRKSTSSAEPQRCAPSPR